MENTTQTKKSPIRWIPTAYFAEGMPFVMLSTVVVIMFDGMGIDKASVTLWTSLIMLPWTLKFLWSPFLEMYRTKKFFIVTTQFITGITFGAIALALHLPDFFAISVALMAIIAFSGATHDIACDGIYMSELSKTDQAKYIGWQGAFYNIGKLFAMGALVYIAGVLIKSFGGRAEDATLEEQKNAVTNSWMVILLACGAVMVLLSLYHTKVLPSSPRVKNTLTFKEQMRELWSVIRHYFTK